MCGPLGPTLSSEQGEGGRSVCSYHPIPGKTPLSLFVGVWPSWSITKKSGLSFVIHNLLAYFLGDVVSNRTQTSCGELSSPVSIWYKIYCLFLYVGLLFQSCNGLSVLLQLHKFIWMQGAPSDGEGICVKTTANFSVAKSPAFDIDGMLVWTIIRATKTACVAPCPLKFVSSMFVKITIK